nr:response regulator [Cytophagales bacterium]
MNKFILNKISQHKEFRIIFTLQMKRVLIEDDELARRLVSNAISKECSLIESANAGNGVFQYKYFDPDIVFLDLGLPDGDGHNILKWIMRNDPGAYVVLFSGRKDEYNIEKALNNGAKGYITKPFNKDVLLFHLRACPKIH